MLPTGRNVVVQPGMVAMRRGRVKRTEGIHLEGVHESTDALDLRDNQNGFPARLVKW